MKKLLFFLSMLLLAACNRPAETFIPAPPDYQDTTMWITVDGDTLGTGADIFYVVSTWEQDWMHDSLVCHYADVWNPEHVLVVSGYSASEYPPFADFINVGDIHSCESWLYSDCIRQNIQTRIQSYKTQTADIFEE